MVTNAELFEQVRALADEAELLYKYEQRSGDRYLSFGVLDVDVGSDDTAEARIYSSTDQQELIGSIYSSSPNDPNTDRILALVKDLFSGRLFQYVSESGHPVVVIQRDDVIETLNELDKIYLDKIDPEQLSQVMPRSRPK